MGAIEPAAVDAAALMDRLDGDRELLAELVELYLEDSPALVEEIRAAIEAGDAERMRRAAHTLKGSVGNFCAPAASAAGLELENAGREGALDRAPEIFDRLVGEIGRVRTALEALVRQ